MDAVNRIFQLFQANWPRRFSSIWPSGDAVRQSKRLWLVAFKDADLTARRLSAGLKAVRQEPWPPDNPGAFLALCRISPSSVGAPEVEAAWQEAVNRPPSGDWLPWSHRCVYWAAVRTGRTGLAERGHKLRQVFELEYQKAVERADELSEPPQAELEVEASPEQQKKARAAARAAIQRLKAMTTTW